MEQIAENHILEIVGGGGGYCECKSLYIVASFNFLKIATIPCTYSFLFLCTIRSVRA